MMKEPSVLDYLKSKLFFWRFESIEIPALNHDTGDVDESPGTLVEISIDDAVNSHGENDQAGLPLMRWRGWWVLPVLGLAFIAQRFLEPPQRNVVAGVVFYLAAASMLIWGLLRKSDPVDDISAQLQSAKVPLTVRTLMLGISLVTGVVAFIAFDGNLFTKTNIFLWGISLVTLSCAFWIPDDGSSSWRNSLRIGIAGIKNQGLHLSPWAMLVLAVFGISAIFRFYQLEAVPLEMFSDHAEKLWDVGDVLAGETRIYFPRNTGREAFQMYLTAAVALIFGTGLSFISLKIGTALAGLVTLPFIYLLGKEVANRRVGLLAMAFAGVAYWPNVISRVALRFALYPLFVAPTLFFLVRGIRRQNSNDFIWAGFALGLGLHGYSPFRFVPLVVLAAAGLYLLHRASQGKRKQTLWGLTILAWVSLWVFSPLLRYALAHLDEFTYRTMTRMGTIERPYPGSVGEIFFGNLWDAITMFFWNNGDTWVHSVSNRPALGLVSAALFFLGMVMIFVRYLRKRDWLDLFLMISIPLLLMPSILALAFPSENPSLNRTAGALIPVFLIIGIALDALMTNIKAGLSSRWGARLPWMIGILLFAWSAAQNYDLVFHQYQEQYARSAWNTSELGTVMRQFIDTIGAEDQTWVVRYPHWADTRLVAINAGMPLHDPGLWPDELDQTLEVSGEKMFLFKPDDGDAVRALQQLYPQGTLSVRESTLDGKDFGIYFVPLLAVED
jgi:hypothetical protein